MAGRFDRARAPLFLFFGVGLLVVGGLVVGWLVLWLFACWFVVCWLALSVGLGLCLITFVQHGWHTYTLPPPTFPFGFLVGRALVAMAVVNTICF